MYGRCRVKFEPYNNQRGAELVELAFILPLFLVLLTGIIEFGRGYNVYQNVTHATREGVRAAASDCLTGGNCTPGNASTLSDTEIKNKIRDHLKGINIDAADSDIVIDANTPLVLDGFKTDPSAAGPSFTRNIAVYRVRVNYTYTFLFLGRVIKLVAPGSTVGSNGIVLSATVVMRDERSNDS
jgi:TadE-like protein